VAGDIKKWLEELGLGKYAQAFVDNEIDFEVFADLTEDDLEKLGLPMGPRKKLLRAAEDLTDQGEAAPSLIRHIQSEAGSSHEAERRHLTVLFCDLVGSTELSAKLDPEDMREVLRAYQEACSKVIKRYDGYVAKFMGDGVYAYFGYPTAHEDDAERAVNAGLEIVEAVSGLEHDLAVRIGVATGNVTVGDLIGEGASEEANVVGEAPNLASRLQGLAEPNTVIIGEATRALASGMFETRELGAQHIRGFTDPVNAWIVLRVRTNESRFQATRGEHLTQLIGREEELEILLRRWGRAKKGEGQVVLISGEPGIGKSRLAQALQDKLVREDYTLLRYQCSPFHTHSALHPIIEQLERVSGFEIGDGAEVKLEKLEAALAKSGRPFKDTAPLFAHLLSIPIADRYPTIEVSPQRRKELTLAALVDQLVGLTDNQPALFVFEDSHWVDPTTLELLEMTLDRAPTMPLLMLITHRPEFSAPWVGRPHVTPMILRRLERRDCALMVDNIAKENGIAESLRDRIADQTDGVPLFVEELTKSVIETSTGSTEVIEVPSTLQDSLEARLDRLGTAKEVAQIGAVIGREFAFDLLSPVADTPDTELKEALDRLVQSELVFRRGEFPDARYTFKHALVQDTAYASLLRSRRKELHERIATVLKEGFPEIEAAEPELLAHHFTEAGQTELAIEYWKRAGENCFRRPAIEECIEHFRRGIELAHSLIDEKNKARLELDLQSRLAPILAVVRGVGAPEPAASYERARYLAQGLDDTEKLFPIVWGQWMVKRGQRKTAEARSAWGQPFQGQTKIQMEHIEKALQIYDPALHSLSATTYGNHDAGCCGLFHKGVIQWAMGYPVRGGKNFEKSVKLADEISHLPTRVFMAHLRNWRNVFEGDTQAVYETANKAIDESIEIGLFNLVPLSISLRGWAKGLSEDPDKGVAEIRQGLEGLLERRATGSLATTSYLLAEVMAKTVKWEEAIPAVEQAMQNMEDDNENLMYANALSLKGDLLLRQSSGDLEEPEKWYKRAIDYAQNQNTKMWELRASTRLARLWQSQGKTTEARDILAPVYNWFTEGFDTADLKEAKALLDELS
jgi:class 3 adenylate cyclase/tetratricopeptide (TPR) repeat protein